MTKVETSVALQSETVLVVIDMQSALIDGPPAVFRREELLTRAGELIAAARHASIPILFVQDDDVGPFGSKGWELHPALPSSEARDTLRKKACDAFHQTELAARLRDLGAKRIVVTGCKTEFCIDTACRRAVTEGYDVVLAGDAHSTTDDPTLPAERIIAHHNRLLDGFDGGERRVKVETTATIVSVWGGVRS